MKKISIGNFHAVFVSTQVDWDLKSEPEVDFFYFSSSFLSGFVKMYIVRLFVKFSRKLNSATHTHHRFNVGIFHIRTLVIIKTTLNMTMLLGYIHRVNGQRRRFTAKFQRHLHVGLVCVCVRMRASVLVVMTKWRWNMCSIATDIVENAARKLS